ncbi:hypothetical protein PK98_08830 [Croceibacterium mercuriale]|uniref:Uncharacterized protein n=1 Tax=Croceibacterium mercuriale TaxID=1572751 RepID=A0A0B2C2V0_9SPHN|nr:hypothetical protein PK98_08830 [Croceibacterium mercuriale]
MIEPKDFAHFLEIRHGLRNDEIAIAKRLSLQIKNAKIILSQGIAFCAEEHAVRSVKSDGNSHTSKAQTKLLFLCRAISQTTPVGELDVIYPAPPV